MPSRTAARKSDSHHAVRIQQEGENGNGDGKTTSDTPAGYTDSDVGYLYTHTYIMYHDKAEYAIEIW